MAADMMMEPIVNNLLQPYTRSHLVIVWLKTSKEYLKHTANWYVGWGECDQETGLAAKSWWLPTTNFMCPGPADSRLELQTKVPEDYAKFRWVNASLMSW